MSKVRKFIGSALLATSAFSAGQLTRMEHDLHFAPDSQIAKTFKRAGDCNKPIDGQGLGKVIDCFEKSRYEGSIYSHGGLSVISLAAAALVFRKGKKSRKPENKNTSSGSGPKPA